MQDASSKEQTKQKYKPNQQRTGLHLTQPCPSEEKQTNKQKLRTNSTSYEAYTNHWANLRRAETKSKTEFNLDLGKGDLKYNNLKKIMKRHRNSQQEREHDKCPLNQTKEEEVGSLPEKEFRIMIVKMIQNLENKMELQVSRLETRIEKM